jgi:hypothetical protein
MSWAKKINSGTSGSEIVPAKQKSSRVCQRLLVKNEDKTGLEAEKYAKSIIDTLLLIAH